MQQFLCQQRLAVEQGTAVLVGKQIVFQNLPAPLIQGGRPFPLAADAEQIIRAGLIIIGKKNQNIDGRNTASVFVGADGSTGKMQFIGNMLLRQTALQAQST